MFDMKYYVQRTLLLNCKLRG